MIFVSVCAANTFYCGKIFDVPCSFNVVALKHTFKSMFCTICAKVKNYRDLKGKFKKKENGHETAQVIAMQMALQTYANIARKTFRIKKLVAWVVAKCKGAQFQKYLVHESKANICLNSIYFEIHHYLHTTSE